MRWRKEKAPTGLARICSGPQGYELTENGIEYASVSAFQVRWQVYEGWYWLADAENVPYKNTCWNPVETEEQAKADAMAYVKQCLKNAAG